MSAHTGTSITEPRNGALIAAVDASKLRLLHDEVIPTEHIPQTDLDRAACSSLRDIEWGGLLSTGSAKFHTCKIESLEARTMRKIGAIQDVQC